MKVNFRHRKRGPNFIKDSTSINIELVMDRDMFLKFMQAMPCIKKDW